jgi:hypothetical protein
MVMVMVVAAGCGASPEGRPCTGDAMCDGGVCAIDRVCHPASDVRDVHLTYPCPSSNCFGWLQFDEGDPYAGRPASSLSLPSYGIRCNAAGVDGSASVDAVPVRFDWVVTMEPIYGAAGQTDFPISAAPITDDMASSVMLHCEP